MSSPVNPLNAVAKPTADPFEGLSGTKSESLSASGQMKIAIVGKQKSGKSWLAVSGRTPMLYYDHDDRAESIAGKPGLLVKSRPTMTDIETDLSLLKYHKVKGKPIPKTACHDTVTFMQRTMEDEIWRQGGKELYREIKVSANTTLRIRKGWDTINGIQRYVSYLISEYTSLGMDIIFVFHEKNEKDYVESTKEQTEYTGALTVDPQYLASTLSLFNEVYHIKVRSDGKYITECRPNIYGNWATTLLLDNEEPPNILEMIAKHEKARAAKIAAQGVKA